MQPSIELSRILSTYFVRCSTLYKVLPILLANLCTLQSSAQNSSISSYSGQSEIKASRSITLTNGFLVPIGSAARIFIDPSLFNCLPLSSLPSNDQNYILTRTFKVAGVTAGNINNARNTCEENQIVQYLDGLGRPVQNVQVQANPYGNDLVQPIAYDALGRKKFDYLSYAAMGNNGTYRTDALQAGTGLSNFYNPSPGGNSGSQMANGVVRIPSPQAETVFEASPLDRVLAQGAPGDSWQISANHTLKMDYGTNNTITAYATTGFAVRLYTATPVSTAGLEYQRTLGGTGYYSANALQLTISRDENWVTADGKAGTVEEYKDRSDKVILKRTFNRVGATIQTLSTYYVYDDYDNLSFVLPPGANPDAASIPNQTILDSFGYQYRYDKKKNLIEKKVPAKGWEYYIYNELDQVLFTQDANQRPTYQWTFTKYDVLGRTILTGGYQDNSTRALLQTNVLSLGLPLWESIDNGSTTGYTNVAYPNVAITAYWTRNYYDNYNFLGMGTTFPPTVTVSNKTKNLLTGQMVYQTDQLKGFWTMYYYDEEARVRETIAQNHLNGTDRTVNTYNFAGELTATNRSHVVGSVTTTIANTFQYDHVGRTLNSTSNINNQGLVMLDRFEYNDLGQLQQKNLHSTDAGSSFAQATKYNYNERAWLKNIASPQFSMRLGYDTLSSPQYNGNISTQLWGSSYGNRFNYTYDRLNRLTSAASTGVVMSETITYDVMGNISTLGRDGGAANLYVYSGNRLDHVEYLTLSYQYDANGNAVTDGRSQSTLTYNHLNLPITASRTAIEPFNIAYTYDANGKKLKKVSTTTATTTTDYIDGIQYTNGAIDFIQTAEGRAVNSAGTYSYQYNLTDQLGNVRYSFDIYAGAVRKLQEDDYYPFGKRKTVTGGNNNYLYNGKEMQNEFYSPYQQDGQYDYGARLYDPVIGRWNVVDPLADKDRAWSPYNYARNNPIRFIDPDGMEWKDPKDQVIADRLQKGISDRLATENSNLKSANDRVSRLEDKIAKEGSSKGLESRLSSARSDVASIGTTISDLNSSSSELTQMGSKDVAQKFTFNELADGSSVGNTYKKDGVITMDIVGDANGVHEATHGYQVYKTGGITQAGRFDAEVSAYQRQFSFDQISVQTKVPSEWGSVRGRSDINKNWVIGINNNGIYIYAPGLTTSDIRKFFQEARKQ